MKFTQGEITQLLVSIITITLAFALAFKVSFFVILITVGVGFVVHEMGHKFTASYYGCTTAYQAWIPGLVIALGLAFITKGQFIFAAPGWVAIYKHGGLTRKEDGIISLAGPFASFALSLIFLWLAFNTSINFWKEIFIIGFSANAFLAFFNMIPIHPLDGSKVVSWSTTIWGILFSIMAFDVFVLPGIIGF